MLTTLAIFVLLAQIGSPGGQIPGGYPGQYPPGQSPGGGLPIPGRSKKTTTSQKSSQATTTLISGVVSKLEEKSVEVRAEDSRIITVTITDQTAMPKDLKVGYSVDVTAKEDDKGHFLADTIKVTKKGEAGTTEAAEGPDTESASDKGNTTLQGPKYDPSDDGPPKLKRGKPAVHAKPASDDADVAEVSKPTATEAGVNPTLSLAHAPEPRAVVAKDSREELIDRAKEEAGTFIEGLPNYICNENTTRYVSEGHVTDWHALDVVSLELVYEGGKEDYRNIQINGKAVKGKVEDTGAWSTGEFGTILIDLFSPSTAARFHYVKDATLSSFYTSLYDFSVVREHSHWHVQFAAQSIFPSYKGSVWIDKKSARVIRIEMQATNIPAEFPEDSIETAVDYGYISLGATDKFFLPTRAEILSCQRGVNACGRNVIEFRNYHRFAGDSKIIFDK